VVALVFRVRKVLVFCSVWFSSPPWWCLYGLLIRFVYTVGVGVLGKVLKAFRFDPLLYAGFKGVVERSGLMVTEAFEKFMRACVEAGAVRLPDMGRERSGVEAEARVLLAWLRKGQTPYSMTSEGEEISVHARLLQMLSRWRTSLCGEKSKKNSRKANKTYGLSKKDSTESFIASRHGCKLHDCIE